MLLLMASVYVRNAISHIVRRQYLGSSLFRHVSTANQSPSTTAIVIKNEVGNSWSRTGETLITVDQTNATDSLEVVYDEKWDRVTDPFSDECDQEFIDEICPPPQPTFNIASMVNQSSTLKKLVDLGVDLFLLEQKRDIAEYLVRLEFDRHIKDHLFFLHHYGFPDDKLGNLITKNPLIFQEAIKNLQTRLRFLKDYGFTHDQILGILIAHPVFINYGVTSIKELFDFLRREYSLTKFDIPNLVSSYPKMISMSDMYFRDFTFCMTEEAGFDKEQIREIIIKIPNIFSKPRWKLINNYDFLTIEAGYTLPLIVHRPQPLLSTLRTLHSRVLYMKTLRLLQPDPKKPGYTPLDLFEVRELEFLDRLKLTRADFNRFLKTM
ncbi:mitochondrial transcription termination factor 3 [Brevipalpus obovatus]|uniref:mitochondrial transcription termination factor 3 n=1 Tax=Brevipalpus obovatus TaxID=246614 RepID=UPI003D9E0BC5